MPNVCVFSRETGPLLTQWPADQSPARFDFQGRAYERHRLCRLVSAREVDEVFVYVAAPVTPADELLIYHTLFPGVGGVFLLEPAP